MKLIKNNLIPLFVFLIGFGIVACSTDEDIVPKTLEEYKNEFSAIVTAEKAKVESCVVGYNKGDFRSELLFPEYRFNYMSALVSAEKVLAKPDVTIAEIFAANKSITSSGKAFNDNLFISDRRPIHELIVVCDTLRVRTPEGTAVGQAPAAARSAFSTAITKAKTVRSASTTIERQVTAAVEELNQELTIFQKAIIK